MWAKIDTAQLRGWQYVVDFYGRHTGQTQFNVVRFLIIMYLASVVSLWMAAPDDALKLIAGIFAALVLIMTPIFFWVVGYTEKNVERGMPNPDKVSPGSRVNRLIQSANATHTIIVCTLKFELEPSNLGPIVMCAAFYLLACDVPPPPKTRESVDNWAPSGA